MPLDVVQSNMKGVYGDSWPAQTASRKKEMTEPDALYFLLQENTSPSEPPNEGPSTFIPGALHAQVVLLIFAEVLVCRACLIE
jgi:hypothetical protein